MRWDGEAGRKESGMKIFACVTKDPTVCGWRMRIKSEAGSVRSFCSNDKECTNQKEMIAEFVGALNDSPAIFKNKKG